MLSIEQLEAKTDAVKDTDLMIIEDADDTKKIVMSHLLEYLQQNSDKKIEDVKAAIIEICNQEIAKITEGYKNVSNAYYDLARNYKYLNSAFEEMKEKMLQIKTDTDPLNISYNEEQETLYIAK
jgi:hypothetical protein